MKQNSVLEVMTGAIFGVAGYATTEPATSHIAVQLAIVAASGLIGGSFGWLGKVITKCLLNRFKK